MQSVNSSRLRIGLIPQDGRPVSYTQPIFFARQCGCEVICPPEALLGYGRSPGYPDLILDWLWSHAGNADIWVVSLDMLFYGGLVPSRTIRESDDIIHSRISEFTRIYDQFNYIHFVGFQSIRRLAATVGSSEDLAEWTASSQSDQFDKERTRNHAFNLRAIGLVDRSILDRLHLLQEDARADGAQIFEQTVIQSYIDARNLGNRVLVTNGTDEGALVLLARYILDAQVHRSWSVLITYSHPAHREMVAMYEDRSADQMIHGQLAAIGYTPTADPAQADLICMVWCPFWVQRDLIFETPYPININDIVVFTNQIQQYLTDGKRVILLDLAYANGADADLMRYLAGHIHLFDLAGFAAWNTAGNRTGFALAQGGCLPTDSRFLLLRFLDDWGYQAHVRPKLQAFVQDELGGDIWCLTREHLAQAEAFVSDEMRRFRDDYFASFSWMAISYRLPWARAFEIDIGFDACIHLGLDVSLRTRQWDVIVVGAGTSGIPAAVAAARTGARVLLVEKAESIGGTLVRSMVYPMMGFHAEQNVPVVAGIAEEIVSYAGETYGMPGHLPDPIGTAATITPIEPDILLRCYHHLLAEAGVTVLTNTDLVSVQKNGNRVSGVRLRHCGFQTDLDCQVLIDATGNGDVAVMAHASFIYGRESDHLAQPMSLMFRMTGVDRAAIEAYISRNPTEFVLNESMSHSIPHVPRLGVAGFFGLVLDAQRREGLLQFRDRVLFFEGRDPGVVYVNMTRVSGFDGTRDQDVIQAYRAGVSQVNECVYVLTHYIPGFEKAHLLDIASEIGIRETRHIIGQYTLTAEDVINGRQFDDAVAYGAFPMDIHRPDSSQVDIRPSGQKGAFYGIPFRSMLPKGIDGLIVTGRAISATHQASASARISATCMGLGEAAGHYWRRLLMHS